MFVCRYHWICDQCAIKQVFTEMVQVNFNKTVTKLSANGMVIYPIHVVMMIATMFFRRFSIDKGFVLAEVFSFKRHIDGRFNAN